MAIRPVVGPPQVATDIFAIRAGLAGRRTSNLRYLTELAPRPTVFALPPGASAEVCGMPVVEDARAVRPYGGGASGGVEKRGSHA